MNPSPDHEPRIRHIRSELHYRRELLPDELNDRELRRMVAAGRFVRVLPGCYIRTEAWDAMPIEDRLLARSLAFDRLSAGPGRPIFSHQSAATIWGLPFYRATSTRIHLLTPRGRPGHNTPGVIRHSGEWNDTDLAEVEGLLVTGMTRTLLDLARLVPQESAMVAADAGLRRLLGIQRDHSTGALAAWKEHQRETLQTLRGYPGIASARMVVENVDPRADSPAESVSRLHLIRLEVPFEIQAPVDCLNGRRRWMDFSFLGQRAFGEMDGAVKYLNPAFRNGRTLEQVLLDEKRRDDEVRGVTRFDILHWGFDALRTTRHFGTMLQSYGVRVPRLEAFSVPDTGARRPRFL